MLNVYIANLGKYNEGELVGKWVELPCDDIEAEIESIGVKAGTEYEEFAIHDYDCDFGLKVHELDDIFALNETMVEFNERDEWEQQVVQGWMEVQSDSFEGFKEAIENIENCTMFFDCDDDGTLGEHLIEECGCLEIPEYLANYIDYERYGRDFTMETSGGYTSFGYLQIQ